MGDITKNNEAGARERNALPRHIAVIMDGNGRWAKRMGKVRTAGHIAGAEVFRTIATHCQELGVEYLTVYAFSTENWKRPESEVSVIMGLLDKYLHECVRDMAEKSIRLKVFGDTSVLSPSLQELIAETAKITEGIKGFQANVCINYGGRAEIVRACKLYASDIAEGKADAELTEEGFSKYLYSADIPDPELIIRTGGESRLSNFLLWQCAYSELCYTDTLWPDFSCEELDSIISDFSKRDRRFGGIKNA